MVLTVSGTESVLSLYVVRTTTGFSMSSKNCRLTTYQKEKSPSTPYCFSSNPLKDWVIIPNKLDSTKIDTLLTLGCLRIYMLLLYVKYYIYNEIPKSKRKKVILKKRIAKQDIPFCVLVCWWCNPLMFTLSFNNFNHHAQLLVNCTHSFVQSITHSLPQYANLRSFIYSRLPSPTHSVTPSLAN